MFETSVIRVQARAADRRYALLTLSVGAHAVIIAAVIAASLASTTMPDRAPNQVTIPVFASLPPALGTPDARPAARPAPAQPHAQRAPLPHTEVAPQTIPQTAVPAQASDSTQTSQTTSTGGGTEGQPGVPWGSERGVGIDGPPVVATDAVPDMPLPVTGEVKAPVVLRRVQPLYPRAALAARMNGFVIVECIIDRTGVIRDAKVVRSSSTLFDQSALDAVQQWQFQPGTLHGRAVDTIFDLTVTFTISR